MNPIRLKAHLLCLIFAGLICLPLQVHAADDLFLSMTGVAGEATNGLIAINSIQWGVGRAIAAPTGSGPNRQVSPPSFSDITLTKMLDSASPQLAFQAANGTNGITCVLTVNDHNTGNTLYTLTLTNVIISGYTFSALGERPTESLSLNFTTIKWSYRKLDSSGNVISGPGGAASTPVGWDLVQQKSITN